MSRTNIYICIFFLALFFVMISSKPSDERCVAITRSAMIQHSANDGILGIIEGSVTVNKYTVAVEDNLFYKKVYSNYDGKILAIGIFGQVILYK